MLKQKKIKHALLISTSLITLSACQSTSDSSNTNIGSEIGAVVGEVLATIAPTEKNKNKLFNLLGSVLGDSIGKNIERYLGEQEKIKMQDATVAALNSNSDKLWESDNSKISGAARVIQSNATQETRELKVLKSNIAKVPPLEIIGENYEATTASNMRGGPSTNYKKVGGVLEGEQLTVVGKVKGKNWYLVSHGGVGTGFIFANLLRPSDKRDPLNDVNNKIDNKKLSALDVETETVCREVSQEVILESGKTVKDTLKACKGPNGWEVIA